MIVNIALDDAMTQLKRLNLKMAVWRPERWIAYWRVRAARYKNPWMRWWCLTELSRLQSERFRNQRLRRMTYACVGSTSSRRRQMARRGP